MRFQSSLLLSMLLLSCLRSFAAENAVAFKQSNDSVEIAVDGRPIATYYFRDTKTLRPFLAHVRAPNGLQVTRNHPPVAGVDATDHDTMHPGIWLAFGDINGADFWRNKARVVHAEFVGAFVEELDRGAFTVRNRYMNGGDLVCEETCTATISVRADGYFLLLESTFTSTHHPFAFGDQEEMGLGVRVATPLAVANGGQILNSSGQENEAGCWGKPALWADYGGTIDNNRTGITLMPHPGNFRPSWFHARDYGFIAANPFGRKAFTGGEPSRVEIAPGNPFRLAYGVYIYSHAEGNADPAKAYVAYLGLIHWPTPNPEGDASHAE